MKDVRIQVRLDPDTRLALQRLANAEDRSMAAQLRVMIRAEAGRRGLWKPAKPRLVSQGDA